MATKKLQDLTASTSPGDADILLIEDTAATKKITFLNLFNRIKTKLGLATVATSGKLADTVKDEDNRTITDAERAKWNGYGNDLASLNSNIEIKVVNYELARCTYSSGNVYTQAGRLIINLTVKVNTTINSYDEIIRNLPEIRPNMAALNFFDVTKESKLATCICQNGTVKLIGGSGNLPAINDAIVITGECLLK